MKLLSAVLLLTGCSLSVSAARHTLQSGNRFYKYEVFAGKRAAFKRGAQLLHGRRLVKRDVTQAECVKLCLSTTGCKCVVWEDLHALIAEGEKKGMCVRFARCKETTELGQWQSWNTIVVTRTGSKTDPSMHGIIPFRVPAEGEVPAALSHFEKELQQREEAIRRREAELKEDSDIREAQLVFPRLKDPSCWKKLAAPLLDLPQGEELLRQAHDRTLLTFPPHEEAKCGDEDGDFFAALHRLMLRSSGLPENLQADPAKGGRQALEKALPGHAFAMTLAFLARLQYWSKAQEEREHFRTTLRDIVESGKLLEVYDAATGLWSVEEFDGALQPTTNGHVPFAELHQDAEEFCVEMCRRFPESILFRKALWLDYVDDDTRRRNRGVTLNRPSFHTIVPGAASCRREDQVILEKTVRMMSALHSKRFRKKRGAPTQAEIQFFNPWYAAVFLLGENKYWVPRPDKAELFGRRVISGLLERYEAKAIQSLDDLHESHVELQSAPEFPDIKDGSGEQITTDPMSPDRVFAEDARPDLKRECSHIYLRYEAVPEREDGAEDHMCSKVDEDFFLAMMEFMREKIGGDSWNAQKVGEKTAELFNNTQYWDNYDVQERMRKMWRENGYDKLVHTDEDADGRWGRFEQEVADLVEELLE